MEDPDEVYRDVNKGIRARADLDQPKAKPEAPKEKYIAPRMDPTKRPNYYADKAKAEAKAKVRADKIANAKTARSTVGGVDGTLSQAAQTWAGSNDTKKKASADLDEPMNTAIEKKYVAPRMDPTKRPSTKLQQFNSKENDADVMNEMDRMLKIAGLR
jgi:hypothetical protein